MSSDDIKRLAVQVAALSQQLELQGRDAVQHVAQAARQLEAGARTIEDRVVAGLRDEARRALAGGSEQVLDDFARRMHDAARESSRAAQALHLEHERLVRGRRAWTAAALSTLTLGALLAAGGSSYVVWQNRQTLARIEYQRELQRLTEAGTLSRCGKDLCARVGRAPERYDDEHVVLR